MVVLLRRPSSDVVGISLSFAAGIMLIIAFLELFMPAIHILGYGLAALTFVGGLFLIFALDSIFPHIEFVYPQDKQWVKVGMLLAMGIALHNLPEGFAIVTGHAYLPTIGLVLATTVAAHNVPEGLITALSLYRGGVTKLKTFLIVLISGLVEPVGALMGMFLLWSFPEVVGLALAFAGGAMIFITADELIPTAHHYGREHFITLGLIAGILGGLLLKGVY